MTNGFVSAGIVTRYDGDTHVSLGDIRLFDADNDPITGNPTQIRKTRGGDNARQGTNLTYDPFALVLTRKDVWSTGTNFDTLFTIFEPDPVTLKVKSMTDTNGTAWGTSFDGFGRVVRSKVTPRGGTEGVLSSTSYSGFELVFDTDGDGVPDAPDAPTLDGRTIAQKVFTDAVPESDVATAPGRTSTTFLDSLGRTTRTNVHLGVDYQNRRVGVGWRSYDALGRVRFVSDPFDLNDGHADGYGVSYNYNVDGTPSCFVRGPGPQPATAEP